MKLAFYKAYQKKLKDEKFSSYVKRLWLDWVIAIASLGKYSHVELVDGDGWFSISPRTNSAKWRKIEPKTGRWDFVELDLTQHQKAKIRAKINKYMGMKYDYIGAIFSITPFCIQKNNKVFCSELVVNLINRTAGYDWLRDGCKYSPSKLHKRLENASK